MLAITHNYYFNIIEQNYYNVHLSQIKPLINHHQSSMSVTQKR